MKIYYLIGLLMKRGAKRAHNNNNQHMRVKKKTQIGV